MNSSDPTFAIFISALLSNNSEFGDWELLTVSKSGTFVVDLPSLCYDVNNTTVKFIADLVLSSDYLVYLAESSIFLVYHVLLGSFFCYYNNPLIRKA